jgi:hypothetical protein
MFDKIMEFLHTLLGKTLCGLVLFFMMGVLAVGYYDDVVCTEEEKVEIYVAMEQKASWNKLDIIQWKLDQAKMEKIKLQNYIDTQQKGQCNDSQRMRINQLEQEIGKLEEQKNQLFNSLKR